MSSVKSLCTKFFLGFLCVVLVVEFPTTKAVDSHSAFMRNLVRQRIMYRLTKGLKGISPAQFQEIITNRMTILSKNEGTSRRILLECSSPMRRGCRKLNKRCYSSILVKRSIDSESQATNSYWYDPVSDGITEYDQELESHHVTKRSASRRQTGRIKINCQMCRRKCF